jgi:hypothetical protein
MKAHYEFGNDPIKIMCFEHKRKKLTIELRYQNYVELCFSHIKNCDFLYMEHFLL